MNMAGNIGSFLTGLVFPHLREWTRGTEAFFYAGAALNLAAIVLWLFARPRARIGEH